MPLASGLTLIRGPGGDKPSSGIGKSSYFMAFEWLLYGGREMVGTDDAPSGSLVSVEWRWGDLNIYRQKSPGKVLKVKKGTLELVDAAAQSYIESLFGSYTFWVSSAYIGQDERCPLLTASGAERLAILNEIAFHQDDPQRIIKAIDAEILKLQQAYQAESYAWNRENDFCNGEIQKCGVNPSWELKTAMIEQMKSRVTQLTSEADKLYQDWLESERRTSQISLTEKRLRDIMLILDGPKVDNVDKEITELQQRSYLAGPAEEYHRLKSCTAPPFRVTQDQIRQAETSEGKVSHQQNVIRKWKLQPEAVSDRVKEIQGQLEALPLLDLHRQRDELETSRQNILRILPRRVTYEEVRRLEENYCLLTCPKCQTSLQYMNGELKGVQAERPTFQEVKEAKEYLLLTNQLEGLEKRLTSFSSLGPKPNQVVGQVQLLRQELQELSQINYEAKLPEVPSHVLRDYHAMQEKSDRLAVLKQQHPSLETLPLETRDELNTKMRRLLEVQERYRKREYTEVEHREVTMTLERLRSDYRHVTSQQVQEANNEKKNIEFQLNRHETYLHYVKRLDAIKTNYQKLLDRQKEIAIWNEFKQKSIEVEYRLLNQVVGSINAQMESILQFMFDGQIQAQLSTTRELSDGRQKAQVNIQILKDGIPKTFKQLSGGQKDRLSLALTLVLSKLQRFPFLLLDESTDSLGEDLKEICIQEIRKALGAHKGSLMIDIGHGDNDGHYDRSFVVS